FRAPLVLFPEKPPAYSSRTWQRRTRRIYAAVMNEAIRPDAHSQAQEGPELSVIVPTFNERDNVTVLYRRLEATLPNVAWEVVFVDDNSPDGTWDVVRELAQKDSRVRCIRRIGRR